MGLGALSPVHVFIDLKLAFISRFWSHGVTFVNWIRSVVSGSRFIYLKLDFISRFLTHGITLLVLEALSPVHVLLIWSSPSFHVLIDYYLKFTTIGG